jgi:hypothetical protein
MVLMTIDVDGPLSNEQTSIFFILSNLSALAVLPAGAGGFVASAVALSLSTAPSFPPLNFQRRASAVPMDPII